MTPAAKQRRYRRHSAGDHSLCDPARACAGDPPAPPTTKFGPSGAELWAAMDGVVLGPAHRVLLVEACRMADRLDGLDRVLSGGDWLTDREDEDGRVVVVMDAALSEARQYATALKAIVAELEPKPKVSTTAQPARKDSGSGLSDLTARIAARRAEPPCR